MFLAARDQDAEAVERRARLPLVIARADDGERRIGDPRENAREGRRDGADEVRGDVCRRRQHHRPRDNRFLAPAAYDADFVSRIAEIAGAAHPARARPRQRALAKARTHCLHQRVHAAAERAQRRRSFMRGCSGRPRFHLPAQHAAIFALPFFDRWERSAQAQLFRIAGVDAGNERRNEVFENLVAEFAPHEIRYRFFFAGWPSASERLRHDFPARPGTQQGSGQHRLRRHGNFAQPALPQDVARRARVGLAQLAVDSEVVDQAEQRFGALKALRAALEEEAVLLDRLDQPADARRGLDQRYRQTQLLQAVRAGQARDAAADYDHAVRGMAHARDSVPNCAKSL